MPIRPKKPRGEKLPVTPQWAALVVDAMEARGIGLRELARELGISHATLGLVTRAEAQTSPHVAAISAALDIPAPLVIVADRMRRFLELIEIIEDADPAEATRILEEAEAAAALIEDKARRSNHAKKRTRTHKK